MRIGIIVVVALIFFYGNNYFNTKVREASEHGNTKHGWYSKYNQSEKNDAMLWMIGFPFAILGIYSLYKFLDKPGKPHANPALPKITSRPADIVPAVTPQTRSVSPASNILPCPTQQTPSPPPVRTVVPTQQTGIPPKIKMKCPRCGYAMKVKLAKRGQNAGNYFLGCSKYPKCTFTVPC